MVEMPFIHLGPVAHDPRRLGQSYRVNCVTGDRYAGEFPRELFRKHGIAYDLASRPRVNCSAICSRF